VTIVVFQLILLTYPPIRRPNHTFQWRKGLCRVDGPIRIPFNVPLALPPDQPRSDRSTEIIPFPRISADFSNELELPEKILLENPAIKYAIMFGRRNFHAGVIIFPEDPFDPSDTQRVIEFRRIIW
jgi:hypothetical protein